MPLDECAVFQSCGYDMFLPLLCQAVFFGVCDGWPLSNHMPKIRPCVPLRADGVPILLSILNDPDSFSTHAASLLSFMALRFKDQASMAMTVSKDAISQRRCQTILYTRQQARDPRNGSS